MKILHSQDRPHVHCHFFVLEQHTHTLITSYFLSTGEEAYYIYTMTITADPEIVVGSIGDNDDDGTPSAPTASVIVGEQQTTLPLASAVIATPINTTTTTTATSDLLPNQATIQLTSGNGTIERSTNPDGSLAVKVITTTRQQTGYNEITTEYFHIPSNMANTVLMTLAAGVPPSSLYRTNMNTRTETISTPITATAIAPPSTATATTTQASPHTYPTATTVRPNPHANWNNSVEEERKQAAQFCTVFAVIAVIIIAVVFAVTQSDDHSSPTPSWSSNNDDYYPSPYTPSYPSFPSPSTPTGPCPPYVRPSSAPFYNCDPKPAERPCEDWENDDPPYWNCIPLDPTMSPQPTISTSPSYNPTVSHRPTISSRPTINVSKIPTYNPTVSQMKIHSITIDNSDLSKKEKEKERR